MLIISNQFLYQKDIIISNFLKKVFQSKLQSSKFRKRKLPLSLVWLLFIFYSVIANAMGDDSAELSHTRQAHLSPRSQWQIEEVGNSTESLRESNRGSSVSININQDLGEETGLLARLTLNQIVLNDPIRVLAEVELFAPPPSLSRSAIWGKRIIIVFEMISGALRGAVFGKLGYDMFTRLNLPSPEKEVLGVLFGIWAGIPIATLGSDLIQDTIKNLKRDPQYVKDLGREGVTRNYVVKTGAFLAGLVSAPPITWIAFDKFYPLVGYGWIAFGIPTFYVRTMLDFRSVQYIGGIVTPYAEKLISYSNRSVRLRLLDRIRTTLDRAAADIQSFKDADAKAFKVLVNEGLGTTNQDLSKNMWRILHPRETLAGQVEKNTENKAGWVSKGAAFLGGIVGAGGMWVYYPSAKSSFVPVLNWLGVANPSDLILSALGGISTSTVSCLTAYATGMSFYNLVTAIQRTIKTRLKDSEDRKFLGKSIALAAASVGLSIGNAIMQTELGLEFLDMSQLWPQIEVCAATTTALATCFWAIDRIFNKFRIDPRAAHLAKINLIKSRLSHMSVENLKAIYQICEAKAV